MARSHFPSNEHLIAAEETFKNTPPPEAPVLDDDDDDAGAAHNIDTGGGAYIGGSVSAGGDFAGRDMFKTGNISGTGIAIGPGAKAIVQQGDGNQDLAALFAQIFQQIGNRPADPDVDQEEIQEMAEKIQGEVQKGAEANAREVERWLSTLQEIAPDILEVPLLCW